MITISIDPTILSFGHFHLRWYSLIVFFAVAVGLWITSREAQRKGIAKEAIYDMAVWVILGGLIGARLFHVIDHWSEVFSQDPLRVLAVWEGGLAIWGAIAGGLVSLAVIAWRKGWNFSRLLDVFAPGAALGQAVGRIACIITGDTLGQPTSGPFGLAYTNPEAMAPKLGVFYAPTPVYEILLNGAIFFLLWRLRKIHLPNGAVFLIYLIAYSAGRFFITFFSSYKEFAFGLNQAQVVSLISLAVAIPLLTRMSIRQKPVQA